MEAEVKIYPSVVEFYDAETHCVHQMKLNVQNFSKYSKYIKFIHSKTSGKFQLCCKESEKHIAPGLEICAVVEYYNEKDEDCKDKLFVSVDDEIIEVPLFSYSPKAVLAVNGHIDFGTTIADGKIYHKEVAILNHGTKQGFFKIDIEKDIPVKISPLEGIIYPGYSQPIMFEFISKSIGNMDDRLNILLEDGNVNTVDIKANVVSCGLQLLSYDKKETVDCIRFGSTYYGTDVVQKCYLFNSSPKPTSYVAQLDENGSGQEVGIDVTKSIITVANTTEDNNNTDNIECSSLISVTPIHSILQPYQKIILYFKFSPRFKKPTKGWENENKLPDREDFAMFLSIHTVEGCVNANGNNENISLDIGLTGTALPVYLSVLPSPVVDFKDCIVGESKEETIKLRNDSPDLPICYAIRSVAHFHTNPSCGYINVCEIKDLSIFFRPNQIGNFKYNLLLEVIGQVCTLYDSSPPVYKKKVINTLDIILTGNSPSVVGKKNVFLQSPKKSQISHSSSTNDNMADMYSKTNTSVNVWNSKQTVLAQISSPAIKDCKMTDTDKIPVYTAHPNDLACSIRPSNRKECIKTEFTKKDRYSYIDTDYSYTDQETAKRSTHKNTYVGLLKERKAKRVAKKEGLEFKRLNNDIDMGMKSAQGLKPPKPTLKEIIETQNDETQCNKTNKLHEAFKSRKTSTRAKIVDGLKATPTTAEERIQCQSVLTPQELFLIKFEPNIVDFGDICAKSIDQKELRIINNLSKTISIQFNIDCKELRQTSPLSQVIPPNSVAKLEVIMEANKLMKFVRNISYVLNGNHENHIMVYANVINVGLELSTNQLQLAPHQGMPVESGLRKCLQIDNKNNMAAEFQWLPIDARNDIAFTIRPAKGLVEAFSSLLCEVVFYPSYSSNFQCQFILQVEGSDNEPVLQCTAEIGPTSCHFLERRLMFGCIPLNLVTTQCAYLKNTSHHHTYFKVSNEYPIEGMRVSPMEGIIPVGGITELQVSYKPTDVQKFDTQVQVSILGWKTVSLRMGGQVELPSIDLDVEVFNFSGVYCGSNLSIPFTIINMTRSKAQLVFDLSSYLDFTLSFDEETCENTVNDGYFCINVKGQESVNAILHFTPTEVASYDFVLPVAINHVLAQPPPPSPYPASIPATRSNQTLTPYLQHEYSPYIFDFPTPRRQIRAIGLRAPLQLSTKCLEFLLPAEYFDFNLQTMAGREKTLKLVNNSDQEITWHFDTSDCYSNLFQKGIFRFVFQPSSVIAMQQNNQSITLKGGEVTEIKVCFQPDGHGVFDVSVPLMLSNSIDPYCYITLHGEVGYQELSFQPTCIKFSPVPLDTESILDFEIIAKGYTKEHNLIIDIPTIEFEDGSLSSVLQVTTEESVIPKSSSTDKQNIKNITIVGQIKFISPKPICFKTNIRFNDGKTIYLLPVSATADNSLLSNHSFLSNNSDNFHIICERIKQKKTDGIESSETVFVPCVSPIRPVSGVSMVTSCTSFSLQSSSYVDSSILSSSSPDSEESRANATTDLDGFSMYQCIEEEEFEESETLEGKYLKEIMKTMQRWFSSQGWSNSANPMTLPYSLRSCYATDLNNQYNTSRSGSWNRQKRKEYKSIFDIVAHLCCKPIPGVPTDPNFPTERDEKIKTILKYYTSLLTFIRCQGGMVATIEPVFLLDTHDYMFLKKNNDRILDRTTSSNTFEFLSRKTWTTLLIQIIKGLVLVRITPQSYKKLILPPEYSQQLPTLNPDPLCSNVYSVHERIILGWVNFHFEQQRTKCWKSCFKGKEPSSRWIVNFDNDFVDSLVLASLLAAYAPYIIATHLYSMYAHPHSAEQCLHNALTVTQALRFLGLDYDIVATDLTEPTSVNMLLLSMYLYQRLPSYISRSTIHLNGSLHGVVTKYIKLQNPSNKPITYQAIWAGKNADDFKLPNGLVIQVPPKAHIQLPVEYKSRFLRPCEGTLILVGKRLGSGVGSTLVFAFECSVETVLPSNIMKCVSPCYELKKLYLNVSNPYNVNATFNILLIESNNEDNSKPLMLNSKKKNKAVISKTDHGQKKKISFKNKNDVNIPSARSAMKENACMVSSFWCSVNEIHFTANATNELEIHFLPFYTGLRQCSILFLNESIGEFIYSIEAESTLPLPCTLPFTPQVRPSSRVTSAMAMHHSQGTIYDDESIIYLHCEAEQQNLEELHLPAHNEAKERAMVIASRQTMSNKELKRRDLTGITSSDTILSAMSSLQINRSAHYVHPAEMLGLTGPLQEFTVEVTSPHFQVDNTLCIPLSHSKASGEESVCLPVTILPSPPGQYSADIILRGANDIRVYHMECFLRYKDMQVEIEFVSATHQSIEQEIPIVNQSDVAWHFDCFIKGEGFTGPSSFTADGHATTMYPLVFKPVFEGTVEGELTLRNKTNGAENLFALRGLGTKALPLDDVSIDCFVNEGTMKVLEITNTFNHKMVFQIFSDLDMITGPSYVTVLSRQTVQVPIKILALKRGCYEGEVYFIYDDEYVTKMGLAKTFDEDSDDDDEINHIASHESSFISQTQSKFPHISESKHFKKPYRLWYSLTVRALPNLAEKMLELTCAVHSTSTVEVLLNNPLEKELQLGVVLEGFDIYGDPSIVIPPLSSYLYQVQYCPTSVSKSKGSLVFQSSSAAEFWYELSLVAKQPDLVVLPMMQCELGRTCSQSITIKNPSFSLVEYHVVCSNTNNFIIECYNDMIQVGGQSELELPVIFTPTALGVANHHVEIRFENENVCSHVFNVSGRGEPPLVNNDHVVHSQLGGNASTIIVFTNPFDDEIIVDVKLKQRISSAALGHHNNWDTSLFSLLLKVTTGILLPPKASLDIPVAYAPDTMQRHDAVCSIVTKMSDYISTAGSRESVKTSSQDKLTWTYNIHGIPTSMPINNNQAPVIKCRARERVEEKLEISFTNINVSTAQTNLLTSFPPIRLLGQSVPPIDVCSSDNYEPFTEPFSYELSFDNDDIHANVSNSTALNLKRKLYDQSNGVITLLFEVVLSPSKSFDHLVHLVITSSSGGVWKYPLHFVSTEPLPDDTIVIKAAGLQKESSVAFRLTSQSSCDNARFEAYFASGMDNMFTVTPSSGVLAPHDQEGTLFTVTYTPSYYGKIHRAKLLIQTHDVQWIYDIQGITPNYIVPQRPAAIDSYRYNDSAKPNRPKNFVRENLRIVHTGVSSPLKGASLLNKI